MHRELCIVKPWWSFVQNLYMYNFLFFPLQKFRNMKIRKHQLKQSNITSYFFFIMETNLKDLLAKAKYCTSSSSFSPFCFNFSPWLWKLWTRIVILLSSNCCTGEGEMRIQWNASYQQNSRLCYSCTSAITPLLSSLLCHALSYLTFCVVICYMSTMYAISIYLYSLLTQCTFLLWYNLKIKQINE